MATSIPIVNPTTKKGRKFIQKVDNLKNLIFKKPTKNLEKVRQIKELTHDQIKNNPFLIDGLGYASQEARKTFEMLSIKRIFVSNYGRKGGATYHPIDEDYFRVFLHLGDPEIYYLDNDELQDEPVAMLNGEGMILPNFSSMTTSITVYQDPIRIIYDEEIQNKISKIRPRNYNRTTLIYDFELKYENENEL